MKVHSVMHCSTSWWLTFGSRTRPGFPALACAALPATMTLHSLMLSLSTILYVSCSAVVRGQPACIQLALRRGWSSLPDICQPTGQYTCKEPEKCCSWLI